MTASKGQTISLTESTERLRSLGQLTCFAAGREKEHRLPLAAVDIEAKCIDRAAHVSIRQTYQNNLSELMEAVYIFPMAAGACVTRFEMIVGERRVKGLVKERAAARAEYQEALNQGHRASLLEQERDNVFTVQVGNIMPGESVAVEIEYVELLSYFSDGSCSLRLPTVVPPRYVSGEPLSRDSVGAGISPDTAVVPDASRISPPLLVDGFDARVALSISVSLPVDAPLKSFSCSQHAVSYAFEEGVKVSLSREDEVMDRDFVLNWRQAKDQISSQVNASLLSGKLTGMVTVLPPALPEEENFRSARDVIFLLDRSGSMSGIKMDSAIRACSILLNTLESRDRFAIGAFDNIVEWFRAGRQRKLCFTRADNDGLSQGDQFLREITARGGTELFQALQDASTMMQEHSSGRQPVLVIVTDGQVADESRILKLVQNRLGLGRVFCVGVDTSVNEGLLKRLANLGGGTSVSVSPGESLEHALTAIGREIGAPLVTDISVSLEQNTGAAARVMEIEQAPSRLLDLFEGRPTTFFFGSREVLAEGESAGEYSVSLKGRFADGSSFIQEIPVKLSGEAVIGKLFARHYLSELEDQYRLNNTSTLRERMIKLSVDSQILCRLTAYLAVDKEEVVSGDSLRQIVQPVAAPAAWQGFAGAPAPAASWNSPVQQKGRLSLQAGAGGAYSQIQDSDMDMIFGQVGGPSQPMPASPPPAPKQASLWGAPARSREMAEPPEILPAAACDALAPCDSPAPGDVGSIEVISRLLEELESRLHELQSALPSKSESCRSEIERLARELSEKLAATSFAFELGRLQSLLRGPLNDLRQALSRSVAASRIRPLVQESLTRLGEAKGEIAVWKGEALPDFWSGSI